MKPHLDAQGVSLIAVGLEELGVEEFVEGKFFTGDLYVDTNKKCYEVLEFKRYSFLSIFGAVLGSKGRATIAKVRQDHVKGDFRGDGLQNGGTLVISKGGEECLLFYKQEHPGEHIDTSLVYQALGIKVDNPVHTASTAAKI